MPLFHASDTSPKELVNIMVHASDTDVLVIAMAASSSMSNCESRVAFIHGTTLRYIPCQRITCLSVCDTESAFHGISTNGLVGMTKHA